MFVVVEHVAWEHLGEWTRALEARGVAARRLRLHAGDSLPPPAGLDAVVVLGGPMNVYDEDNYPFLSREDAFIRETVRLGVPYLGVCLGAQLLAKALDARVYANRVKEIGYYALELTVEGQHDPLLAGLSSPFAAFQWHEDTFDLPQGAALLATSPSCAHQAFRYGRNAYGLQFHLEAGPEMVGDWCHRYPRELASLSLTPDSVGAAALKFEAELGRLRERLLDNFLGIAASVPAAARETR